MMTPEQIMDALRFLHTAREQAWKSDPLHDVYGKQIMVLLEVQKIKAVDDVEGYDSERIP